MLRSVIVLVALVWAGSACQPVYAQAPHVPPALAPYAGALVPVPNEPLPEAGKTYVPVYSSVMAMSGRTRIDFSVTLAIHNSSAHEPLVVRRIDYFNTSGMLIQAYLDQAVSVRPYGTIQVNVPQEDVRGGLGANFVVEWQSMRAEPVIEAVMLSSVGTQGYSFLSVGRRISP